MSARATNAYIAKAAIIERLKQLSAAPGNALSGRQVLYAFRASLAERICVYGGGITFDQPGDDDVVSGPNDRVAAETATVGIHIRASIDPPPDGSDVEASDLIVEEIGDAVAAVLMAEPRLAGGQSITRIIGGQGDYSPDDANATSILSLRVTVESYLT